MPSTDYESGSKGKRDEQASALREIDRQAFGTESAKPATRDDAIIEAVRLALVDVVRRRQAAPLVSMPIDVTGTLPSPRAISPSLSDADYQAGAERQQLEAAAIKAVAIVESGGRSGFDERGRPKILFEAHHFGPLTQNRFNKTHPHLAVARGESRKARVFYRWDQYERLYEAMLLDVDAALKAASWGKFQILGFNHNGWADVRSFVTAMYHSEADHLKSFEAYCRDNHLLAFVRAHNWIAFARGYNGPQQEGYDQRIVAAYASASQASGQRRRSPRP